MKNVEVTKKHEHIVRGKALSIKWLHHKYFDLLINYLRPEAEIQSLQ